jgi:hypothetical protein
VGVAKKKEHEAPRGTTVRNQVGSIWKHKVQYAKNAKAYCTPVMIIKTTTRGADYYVTI